MIGKTKVQTSNPQRKVTLVNFFSSICYLGVPGRDNGCSHKIRVNLQVIGNVRLYIASTWQKLYSIPFSSGSLCLALDC